MKKISNFRKILEKIEDLPISNGEKMLVYRGCMMSITGKCHELEDEDFEAIRLFLERRRIGGVRGY